MPNKRFDAVKEIDGWFYMEDAILFETISTVQAKSRITGDLLKIGAYHGKSAAFLGFLLGAKEQLVVCDLFETPAATATTKRKRRTGTPPLIGRHLNVAIFTFTRIYPGSSLVSQVVLCVWETSLRPSASSIRWKSSLSDCEAGSSYII